MHSPNNLLLRKFPYPYSCALSISSDIDNATSLKSFLLLMDFINGSQKTIYGMGLGLEFGNSFWFYNSTPTEQLSYFQGTSNKHTSLAPYLRSFWESGHVDSLHSYGNFDNGGFTRFHAERAIEELHKYNVKLPVWINHGIGLNHQKVGNYPEMHGDNPKHTAYHLDLSYQIGCEYFWIGKNTHVVGQDAERTVSIRIKSGIQRVLKQTRYRNVKLPIFNDSNSLLEPINFRDGSTAWEFQRWINAWGETTILDIHDLHKQISPSIINTLISNQGFMIVYTHLNENVKPGKLPKTLIDNLNYLQQLVYEKRVLMSTTSRLLKYKEVLDHIHFDSKESDGAVHIVISENLELPFGTKLLTKDHLQGLTFYISDNRNYEFSLGNQFLPTIRNPKDETGYESVSIPWVPLEYPR